MDLTTRCPQCGTTFAASLEQLQLRKGFIRCVQCAHIFDGYEAVVPATTAGIDVEPLQPCATALPVSPEKTAEPALTSQPLASTRRDPVPSVVRGRREFTISDRALSDTQDDERFWTVPAAASAGQTAEHKTIDLDRIALEPERSRFDLDDVRIDPDAVVTESDHVMLEARGQDTASQHAERWREPTKDAPSAWWHSIITVVWGAVIAAGVVLFAAQLIYVFRVQIAENIPPLRPALEKMCTALDCTVPYSRQIDLIVITKSSLQQDPDEGDNGDEAVLLQFALRNVHDGPQEWPTLILELKDFAGALIARKHLSKHDYLPADLADEPFPADSERMIALPLTTQGLQVNGYQLTAFFP